jgi:hypothetical protein
MAKRKSKAALGLIDADGEVSAEWLLEQRKKDEESAMAYLVGVVEYDDKDLPHLRPLRGAAETKAKEALIRLLREQQLTPAICAALAILFGGEVKAGDLALRQPSLSYVVWARYRKLEITKRGRGANHKRLRRSTIADRVWADINAGTRPEEAKRRAAEKYSLSQDAIKSIMREFG